MVTQSPPFESSGPSKQQAKSLRARDAICEATIQSLYEVGYADTSLNKVAAMAGFSKGALQHHFPSKEELIAATVDRLLNRAIHPDTNLSQAKRNLSAVTSVEESMLRSWQRMVNTAAYRALLEILNTARTDKTLQQRIQKQLHTWGRALDEQSIGGFEAISGSEEDVRALMAMYRAFMRGLIINEHYIEDAAENEALIKRWISLVAPLLRLKQLPEKNAEQ